ncbi:DUF502 domain-containing protein [Acuticoccus sp. M5D2P5]|uniref:DUF502 domain-containing protein n=1 Tax=Acuticoccus kalidii TaxID=2910977 RepID=UPI001F427240|nr:DUF502 domain-containing protein [Acuticoccus kalidii]MCF3935430.1 DUF502 domain-containing protein [Acuticoccus kalidii]
MRSLIPIVRPIMTGILAILPIIVTIFLIGWVANYVRYYFGPNSAVGSLLESIGAVINESFSYAIGAAIALAGLYAIGLLVQSRLRELWNKFFAETIGRIPLIGTIYTTITRFVQLLEKRDDVDVKSMSPVWCFFSDERRTAVLGLMPSDQPVEIEGNDYRIVMVPTAPVPFGGGLFFLPAEWVRPAAFGVEGLTNIYVSMGVTAPDYMGAIKEASSRPATVVTPDGTTAAAPEHHAKVGPASDLPPPKH